MNTAVRVRIALSPTGSLSVDTARTAVLNWLYARRSGGRFLIRIEDADAQRSDSSRIDPILNALKWIGLNWDEEVVYQSQRRQLYQDYSKTLLENKLAYPCICPPAERETARADNLPPKNSCKCLKLAASEVQAKIDAGIPFAVRLRIPEGETVYNDIISGENRRTNEEIEDFVLVRSDGLAMHNFATVIDDHEMGITHILGGIDHKPDSIEQIHLYRALGWKVPEFGHVPPIVRPDYQDVSSRTGHKDVAAYKNEGILPGALFNYLCLLGWSPRTERRIYMSRELVGIFDPHQLNSSSAIFREEELIAFNRAHIQLTSDHDLAVLVAPMLVEAGVTTKYWLETRWEYLRSVITFLKAHVSRVSDFVSLGGYFFSFDGGYDPEAAARQFNLESAELLEALAERFEKLREFTHETTEKALESLADEKGLKKARLAHPTRLAVSGMSDGPALYDLLVVLTKPIVLERLKKAIEYIRRNHQITLQG